MAQLTEQERITILMMRGWGDRVRSFERTRSLFNQTFRVGQVQISRSTVKTTVTRFHQTGSVKDRPRTGRPATVSTEDNVLNIALAVTEDPHNSIMKMEQQFEMSSSSVHRILTKTLKFHPYKVKPVHELNEDDPDRRLEFAESMMLRIDEGINSPSRIVFSDESTFFLNGQVNRHNMNYWSDANPNWMIDNRSTQRPQKTNVWAGILDNKIIGPFFIEGNLDGQKYLTMLRDEIIPSIRNIAGQEFNQTWFQQDGAAPHYSRQARDYLDQQFPERWIGRRGTIEWPARSPDLTPLDYFLWGYLKDRVYRTKPSDIAELQQRIRDETAGMDEEMIQRAVSAFYQRLAYCQESNGGQFEHKLS